MRRGSIFVILFIVLAAGVIGASQFLRSQPPLEVTILVSPLAEAWVSSASASFNAATPLVNGTRPVLIRITPTEDFDVWTDEAQRRYSTGDHPAGWIPSSSASITYASRLPFTTVTPSTARTLLAWGGFSDRVDAVSAEGAFDWSAVQEVARTGRWTDTATNVVLAFSRPNRTQSGMAVLWSAAGAFADDVNINAAVVASDFQAWTRPILESVPNFNTLGASVAGTIAARGASVGQIALLPESDWLSNLRGTLIDNANPLRLAYPEYQVVFDFPLTVWADTINNDPDAEAAVREFGAFLLTPAQQISAQSFGLRPAEGVPTEALFTGAVARGGLIDPPLARVVNAPGRTEMQRMITWIGQLIN